VPPTPFHPLLRIASACLTLLLATAACAAEAPKVTYDDHVRPLLREHCFACHSQDDRTSDLALDTYRDVMTGGAGGEVVQTEDPDGSRLWNLVNHDDTPTMPPDQDKLPADQLAVIRAWIEGGLLENSGSQRKARATQVRQFQPTADNRPQGEPAMPQDLLCQPVVAAEHPGAVDALAASPWAPLVAIGGPYQVALYHADTSELLGILPYPEGRPRVLRFSRDGSLLLVAGGRGGAHGNAALYDVQHGNRLATFGEEVDEVLAADVSPDLSLVALGGPKKTVRVYHVSDRTLAYSLTKHTDWITALRFSPDGKLLATADRVGGVFLWEAPSGIEHADLKGHQQQVAALAWRADSAQLATASEDATVRLWQTDGKQVKSINAHPGGALDVAFARDGQLATCGRDRHVKLWHVDGNPKANVVQFADVALAVAFTSEPPRVVASDWTGDVGVWEVEKGERLATLPPNPPTLEVRLAAATAEVSRAEQAVSAATQQLAAAQAPLAAAEAAHETWRKQLRDARQRRTESDAHRGRLAKELVAVTTAWQQATQAVSEALANLARAEQEVAAAREQSMEGEGSRSGSEAERQAAAQAAVSAMDEAERQVKEQLAAVQQAEAKLAQLAADRGPFEDQIATATADLQSAQTHLAQLDTQRPGLPPLGPLRAAVAEAQTQLATANQAVTEAQRRRAIVASQWDAYRGAGAALAAAATARADEVVARQTTLAQSQSQYGELVDQRSALQAQLDQLTAQIAQLQSQLETGKGAADQLDEQTAAQAAQLKAQEQSLEEAEAAAEAARRAQSEFESIEQLRRGLATHE
jgi:WD40 repeat protein